jgi:rubredoxin
MVDVSGAKQMSVFPVKQVEFIKNIMFCIQCGNLFNEQEDTKDHGICSLDCGYEYRGLHWSDFI